MDETRWLNDQEQAAWRSLAAVLLKVPAALEQQLQRDAGIGHFDYFVLALLSEAPDRSLRLSHLAEQANASLSRLSHVVTRLEKKGWVVRRPCPDDARATFAALTDEGYEKVVATAPSHVERVRTLVFDGLGEEGVEELRRVCDALLEGVDRTS